MKANELMINDYVEVDGKICKVAFISQFGDINVEIDDTHSIETNNVNPIQLAPEILEKNGFKRNGFINISPDFYYYDDACQIDINFNSTCDKKKSIWVENRKNKISATIEEARHSLEKKPLYVHELHHLLGLCKIDKEIEL